MSRTLQFKRRSNTALTSIVGANGEIIVDDTNYTLSVHDGVKPGGTRLATEQFVLNNNANTNSSNSANELVNGSYIVKLDNNGDLVFTDNIISLGPFFSGGGGVISNTDTGSFYSILASFANQGNELGYIGTFADESNNITAVITTINGTTQQNYNWSFTNSGSLQFPDNSIQTTAYTGSVLFTAGEVTGNVTINGDLIVTGSEFVTSNATANVIIVNETLYSGLATRESTPLPNLIAQFTSNSTTYVQVNAQNIDPLGSADYVVTADVGNDTDFYIDMGYLGSEYNNLDPNNSIGTAGSALDGYLYVQGSTIGQPGGNLILGTTSTFPGLETKFVSGGSNTENVIMTIGSNGVNVTGNLKVSGALSGILPGPFANDTEAASHSVAIHAPYFLSNGTVVVRLT